MLHDMLMMLDILGIDEVELIWDGVVNQWSKSSL